MPSDLPVNFDATEAEFRRFLADHAYPSDIAWTSIDHVIVDQSGHYFVRPDVRHTRARSERRYLLGVQGGLGVQLRAMCASKTLTFACVDVPKDATDAQYRMMGPGLKMSCPDRLVKASRISVVVRWYLLKLRNRGRSRVLQMI